MSTATNVYKKVQVSDDDQDFMVEDELDRTPTQYNQGPSESSMENHIPETNIGYKMLQKMGWKAGKGLGSREQGRVDPIRINFKDDSLGIGKEEEYVATLETTASKRKALDSEKQLEETEIQRIEREHRAEKIQAIAKELEQVKRAFYCELCDKQYGKISEYEQHLQSYDHHHKKRFKEMKENARNSNIAQSEREKRLARERKREEKELKRLQAAMQSRIGNQNPNNNGSNSRISVTSSADSTQSSVSESGGGWSQVSTTTSHSNCGRADGWATVSDNVATNTASVSTTSASHNTTGGGGWATISDSKSGWSGVNRPIKDESTTGSTATTVAASNTPTSSRMNEKGDASTQPKKLTFGLKKNTGFQFGLRKK